MWKLRRHANKQGTNIKVLCWRGVFFIKCWLVAYVEGWASWSRLFIVLPFNVGWPLMVGKDGSCSLTYSEEYRLLVVGSWFEYLAWKFLCLHWERFEGTFMLSNFLLDLAGQGVVATQNSIIKMWLMEQKGDYTMIWVWYWCRWVWECSRNTGSKLTQEFTSIWRCWEENHMLWSRNIE